MLSNFTCPNITMKDYNYESEPKVKRNSHELTHPYEILILLELRQIKKQLNLEQSTTKIYKIENGKLVNEIPVTSHQQIRDLIDSDIKVTEEMSFEHFNVPRFEAGKPRTLVHKDYEDDFEECYWIYGQYYQYLFNI